MSLRLAKLNKNYPRQQFFAKLDIHFQNFPYLKFFVPNHDLYNPFDWIIISLLTGYFKGVLKLNRYIYYTLLTYIEQKL